MSPTLVSNTLPFLLSLSSILTPTFSPSNLANYYSWSSRKLSINIQDFRPSVFIILNKQQMENQPPTGPRSWFRLASLARMEAAQAQDQAPTPPPPRPITQAPAQVSSPAPAPPPPPPRPITQAPIPRIPLARALTMLAQPPQLPQVPPQQQQETAPRSSADGAASDSQQPPKPQNSVNGAASDSQQPPKPQNSVNGAASDSQQPPKPPRNSTPPPSPRPRIPSRDPTPPGSPRVIKPSSPTPPESPKTRQLQPSLTPPPPPHPEPEPKTSMEPLPKSVFMQREDTTNGNGNGNGNSKVVADAESRVEGQTIPPLPWNKSATNERLATRKKDDGEMKVITMAGENMGAYMDLGSPQRHHKHHLSGKHPNGHHQQHHDGKDTQEGELGNEDGKVADKKKGEGKEGKPMAVVVNSNVQSVNNSILLSSSCSQHSPGVHITIASRRKPKLPNSSFRKGNPHFR